MRTREEVFDIYLDQYSNDLRVKKISNPFYIPDEKSIVDSMQKAQEMYSHELPEIVLSDSERLLVINKIKAVHSVYQEEGDVLLGDYDHDYKWYDNFLEEGHDEYYWTRYKNYLAVQKHFPPEVIKRLEETTLRRIMSYLGNPNESDSVFSVRGLVMGDVQSGKTSNYLGLVTKAADAGYKVIFILTGTIENLRKQTQERVEEGFVGYDVTTAADVGVGRGDRMPRLFTSRAKDFVADDDQNTNIRISTYPSEPMVFVIKKNVSVLKKVFLSFKNINTTRQYQRINVPMLMIDDEADNASINTHKQDDDPTKINNYIRKILALFTRSCYVGFTATPFANVFINYDSDDEMLRDDLFPRDFIYSLKAPSNYYGPRKYFFEENENVREIKDGNENIFPMKHKKDWHGDKLFNSVYYAVNAFLLANAIRDIRDGGSSIRTNRSMLINMTRFTKVQLVIKVIITDYFLTVKNALKQTYKLDVEYALTNPLVSSLHETFNKEYGNIISDGTTLTWAKVFPRIYDSIKNIQIVVVNSSKQSAKIDYEAHKDTGLRVIAIGGLALSRGLTLEGLCVSYFYRNTATFDVLMQMGRWFGYREGYADLCKIFITKDSAKYYRYICSSIEDLRKDIEVMGKQGKKPEEYGIRVRNDSIELGITAANKSRNTKKQRYYKSFYGNIFETPYLHRDLGIIEQNINAAKNFLSGIDVTTKDSSVRHPYFRNISKDRILKLLGEITVHKLNGNFDIHQITDFLHRTDSELDYFDVLVIGGEKDNEHRFIFPALHIDNPLVRRNYDVPDDDPTVIRISRQRARLGGRADAKNGLDKSQCPKGDDIRAQRYMIKGRNPLFIIYFIDPDNSDLENEEIFTGVSASENIKVRRELQTRRYNYLIGFAIAFPEKENAVSESIMYTVNKSVNYFDKDHDDEGDDCNE